ncbi:MAG: hypothetical protein CMJ46_06500 [Planctomyces sp.]|nr:hypothetical protein [Planctomyces sp.]
MEFSEAIRENSSTWYLSANKFLLLLRRFEPAWRSLLMRASRKNSLTDPSIRIPHFYYLQFGETFKEILQIFHRFQNCEKIH